MTIDLSNTKLYSIKQVCEMLGVSRSTLDRWRGVSGGSNLSRALGVSSTGHVAMSSPGIGKVFRDALGGTASFPEPDTYLNDSPRWKLETLNQWVNSNSSNRPRSPFGNRNELEE